MSTDSRQQPRRHPCIVAGYDGSETARAAVRYAATRAGADGRLVVVLAAGAAGDPVVDSGAEFMLESPAEHGRALLDELVMEEAETLAQTDFDVALARGNPARAIVHAATVHDADEIAIGTRGAGRVGSLLGSVAQDVLHRADRPVLVIPKQAVESWAAAGATVQPVKGER